MIDNAKYLTSNEVRHVTTLIELLRLRAEAHPAKPAYTFLQNGEHPAGLLTYGELDRQARAIAVWLAERGGYKERAILVYKVGLEFIAAFMGCLYAGVEAIALVPPHLSLTHPSTEMFRKVAHNSKARFVFAEPLILGQREKLVNEFGLHRLEWVNLEEVLADPHRAASWRDPGLRGGDVTHLQYTSGSTDNPKGVKVTHRNILVNLTGPSYGYNPNSVGVTWLPHFHDMGLVNALLQSMYEGFHTYIMSPTAFIQKPVRWLQAITRFRGTHIAAPNFAFELCIRRTRPELLETLDLSSLEAVISGAEPVRWDTLVNFNRMFAPVGFDFHAFQPAYGLAEATLAVATGFKGDAPKFLSLSAKAIQVNRVDLVEPEAEDSVKLVACGQPISGSRVAIVDPLTLTEVEPDQIGEIWVMGESVAAGYVDLPELTAATFEARLANGEGPFLRTGDLGFLKNGELYISGRSKDLIIIRGRNHWPQDLEMTVEQAVPAMFRADTSAAFSVELNNEERLVVTAEVRPGHPAFEVEQVVESVRRAVAERHDLNLYELVLLKRDSLPKTTSGKVRRQATRQAWINKTLEVYLG